MKRSLKYFSVQVISDYVHVEIYTDRKKPHKYRIWKDERHPDIFEVARHLNEGLSQAQKNFSKIEVSEDIERMYVFIKLPVAYHSDQYSAQTI